VTRELLRKSIHVGLGLLAGTLRWLLPWQAAAAALAALVFNIAWVHRLTRGRLLRPSEIDARFSWGVVLYPASILAAIVVFHRRLELAAATWGLLAFGDGMAAIVGTVAGGPRLPWNRAKRWSGSLAFVVWGTGASALLIRWTQLAVLEGRDDGAIGASFLALGDRSAPDVLYLLAGCLAAALAAGLVETLDTRIDDNVGITLIGGAMLYAATLVEPARLIELTAGLPGGLMVGAAVNAPAAVAARVTGHASRSGASVGALLGTALFVVAGWPGWLLLFAFVVVGSIATRVGASEKRRRGIAERSGGRTAGQALANTGAGVLFAFLAAATSETTLFQLAAVTAFATALADTVATEIGGRLGARPYRLVPAGVVMPGTPGAVSFAGTAAGMVAAAIVSAVGFSGGLIDTAGSIAVVVGAGVGSLLESVVGGMWQLRRPADHDLLNFFNTVLGAAVAVLLVWSIG